MKIIMLLSFIFVLSLSTVILAQEARVTSKTSNKEQKSTELTDLPQSPVVTRLTTDAQDENLKGKVKKVVEEIKFLSGNWVQYGRYLSEVTYFNELGALIRNEGYIKGEQYFINVYGYINGKRVSKDIPVKKSPKLGSGSDSMGNDNDVVESEILTEPDNRYTYNYTYKYENGKQIEMQMLFNTGKKGMRHTKKYSKNTVEKIAYTESGIVNVRDIITLDDFGNEIEQVNYVNSLLPNKYGYKYVFDKQGNWIKQIKSKEVTKDGKSYFQPLYETYRTITYY
jgi:hypothetical protein